MKQLTILILLALSISCANQNTQDESMEVTSTVVSVIDTEAELKALEELRSGFMQAIKEKRYQDMGNFAHPEIIAIAPESADWKRYKEEREAQLGQFSYDSIRMFPSETVILNDSMAYDFGYSKVYYTNKDGESVELYDSFIALLKKDKEGKWKLFREVASSGRMPE